MDWAINNMAETLLILGILLLVIEVAVLGFSTFVLFFVGVAALLTAALLFLGIIPDTLLAAMLTTGILTAISAVVLWKPLKNMQSKVDTTKAEGDLVGHSFVLVEDVGPQVSPDYHYSGIEWKLIATKTLPAGTKVEVVEAEVGKFHIEEVQ
jgi:membrane protein implicated in regulation of membrane protease activity